MTLEQLFEAVKDESLSLQDIERYRDQMIHLHTRMQIEMADIEKSEAIYFNEKTQPDVSDVSIKRIWRATEKGQRQILLNRYLKAIAKEIDSLRSRVYRLV